MGIGFKIDRVDDGRIADPLPLAVVEAIGVDHDPMRELVPEAEGDSIVRVAELVRRGGVLPGAHLDRVGAGDPKVVYLVPEPKRTVGVRAVMGRGVETVETVVLRAKWRLASMYAFPFCRIGSGCRSSSGIFR